jgi:uncharacterized membrane protein
MMWWVPFYWLIPSAYTALFLWTLSIAASGFPFYFIARRVLDAHVPSLLMTAAYLFYPTIASTNVNQVYFEPVALPFLVGAICLFVYERFSAFVVLAVLAMMGQENLLLTIGVLGIYAAVKRRSVKWIATPILLALGYGLFVFNVAFPYFSGGRGYGQSFYFASLASSPGELVKVCLTEPGRVIAQICQADRLMWLLQLLQPLLWITPFFAPEALIALPQLGVNALVDNTGMRVVAWYGVTLGAAMCVAAAFGVKRLAGIWEKRWQLREAQLALAFGVCALSVSSWPFWLDLNQYRRPPQYQSLDSALKLVPDTASVLAPASVLAHLANRNLPMQMWMYDPANKFMNFPLPREGLYTLDYIILDGNERRFPSDVVTRDLVMSFYTNTNYRLILNENNVFVFQRTGPGSLK